MTYAQAEIDKMVPDVSKQFLPQMSVGFKDPRVQLHICDGIKYVQDAAGMNSGIKPCRACWMALKKG